MKKLHALAATATAAGVVVLAVPSVAFAWNLTSTCVVHGRVWLVHNPADEPATTNVGVIAPHAGLTVGPDVNTITATWPSDETPRTYARPSDCVTTTETTTTTTEAPPIIPEPTVPPIREPDAAYPIGFEPSTTVAPTVPPASVEQPAPVAASSSVAPVAATPTAPRSPSAAPVAALPVTGAATWVTAGIAAVLLALGLGAVRMARKNP
jgi:hypothetical protein